MRADTLNSLTLVTNVWQQTEDVSRWKRDTCDFLFSLKDAALYAVSIY